MLGQSSVGKTYLAQALLNAACRKYYTARYFRLDDLANRLAVLEPTSQRRLDFLTDLHNCDLLVLDDFLTTPVAPHTAAELLNILAAREGRGSTLVTSQFDPPDWYKSLQDAVIAESILNRIVAGAEIIALDGPNMRRHLATTTPYRPSGRTGRSGGCRSVLMSVAWSRTSGWRCCGSWPSTPAWSRRSMMLWKTPIAVRGPTRRDRC